MIATPVGLENGEARIFPQVSRCLALFFYMFAGQEEVVMKLVKSSILAALSSAVALMIGSTAAQAATVQRITHNSVGIDQQYYSQGITIGTRHDWDTISFAFDMQSGAGFDPYSEGDLFILTVDHLGAPAELGASTSGFLAQSNGYEDGFWTFERGVTLNAGSTYYFVMGDRENAATTQIFGNEDQMAYGHGISEFSRGAFSSIVGDLDYMLKGEIATSPVPLPATALMLMLGIGSLGAVAARRRRTA